MKTFYKIDYKGKYFTIEDEITDEAWDYPIGKISKEEALKPEFVRVHNNACRYYGIAPYFGKDKDLLKVYK